MQSTPISTLSGNLGSSCRDRAPLLNTRVSSYTSRIGARAWVWAPGEKRYQVTPHCRNPLMEEWKRDLCPQAERKRYQEIFTGWKLGKRARDRHTTLYRQHTDVSYGSS